MTTRPDTAALSEMDRPPTLEQMMRMMACHAAETRGVSTEPAWRFYQAAEENFELWRPFVLGQYPVAEDQP